MLDALAWASVLTTRGSVANLPASTVGAAQSWAVDALAALTQRYASDEDGALGWASRAEAFTWIVRAVCTADVVLQAGGGQGKAEVKLGLARLVGEMKGHAGHGVLVERAEEVLSRDVMRGLGMLKGVAKEAPGYAQSWL